MFDRWLIAGAATAIEAALASIVSTREGAIAVVGESRVARALSRPGRTVAYVDVDARAAARGARPGEGLPDRAFAAVVGCHVGGRADWEAVLAAWSRAVVHDGAVVLVDRAAPVELSRRALCSGLAGLEQRVAGRWTVTSGRVCHW